MTTIKLNSIAQLNTMDGPRQCKIVGEDHNRQYITIAMMERWSDHAEGTMLNTLPGTVTAIGESYLTSRYEFAPTERKIMKAWGYGS